MLTLMLSVSLLRIALVFKLRRFEGAQLRRRFREIHASLNGRVHNVMLSLPAAGEA